MLSLCLLLSSLMLLLHDLMLLLLRHNKTVSSASFLEGLGFQPTPETCFSIPEVIRRNIIPSQTRPFPSMSFQIYYSINILPFDAGGHLYELPAVSVNESYSVCLMLGSNILYGNYFPSVLLSCC